jgi:hypothetical protein
MTFEIETNSNASRSCDVNIAVGILRPTTIATSSFMTENIVI